MSNFDYETDTPLVAIIREEEVKAFREVLYSLGVKQLLTLSQKLGRARSYDGYSRKGHKYLREALDSILEDHPAGAVRGIDWSLPPKTILRDHPTLCGMYSSNNYWKQERQVVEHIRAFFKFKLGTARN